MPGREGAGPDDGVTPSRLAVDRRPPLPHRPPGHVVAVVGECVGAAHVVGAAAVVDACVGGAPVDAGGGDAAAVVLTEADGAAAEGAAVPSS